MIQKLTALLIAYGPLGVFLLGFIDSAGIPVAAGMDALIVLVGIQSPDTAYRTALAAVAGSLAGNLVLFYIARRGGRRYAERQSAGKPQRLHAWFNRYGLATVFIPAVVPLIPLPLKVFVISAGVLRTPPARFTAVIVLARVIHYFGVAWIAIQLGEGAQAFLRGHVWHITGGAAALLLLMYALVRLNERRGAATP